MASKRKQNVTQDVANPVVIPEVIVELFDIPSNFVDFCSKFGLSLEPGQRAMCSVLFDRADPIDLETHDQRDRALRIFGCERIPAKARTSGVLAAVCGARGGKSVVFAWRLVHLAFRTPLQFSPGEGAYALIVAPDQKLAGQTLDYAEGCARQVLAKTPTRITQSSSLGFTLTRAAGEQTVRFLVLPASAGGKATRGRAYVGAIVEECAFFRDETSAINDRDVFDSISPRVMSGGELLVPSTPWARNGLLFDLHEKNHGHPVDAVVAHAPTWELRSDERILSQVSREKERDEWNYEREFGARFVLRDQGGFFEPEALARCVA